MKAEQLFKELGFRKNQSVCYDDINIKYEKESSNGCDILTVHFYNGTFVYTENMNRALMTDGKMLKAIYRQMMELGWLDSERKAIYHLTKLEYDLLNKDKEIHEYPFKCFDHLMRLKKQGHFKDVNEEKWIGEILLNCEVV